MNDPARPVWFPAKRYGWGWGPPTAWQGWAVMGVWLALVVATAVAFAGRHWVLYGVSLGVLGDALIGICWLKGERPRSRWGGGIALTRPAPVLHCRVDNLIVLIQSG